MNKSQSFHETLIPLLVSALGARSYLEFGTHANETIGKVACAARYGVDTAPSLCEGITFFTMTTQEFIDRYAALHAPYDFVFIDADHECERAWADFTGILPYVSPEGLVLLHDTNPASLAETVSGLCADSWKIPERLAKNGCEAVTLPYAPGLTIVRKRIEWEVR